MYRKTKLPKINFKNILDLGFEYFFWCFMILGLFLTAFSEFKLDAFHIILSIIVIWMSLGLYFMRKFVKVDTRNSLLKSEIKNYLSNRFHKIYFIGSDQKIIVASINEGFLFSRKEMTVLIKKESVEVNIKTLGRFDIPSIFHSIGNYRVAKNIAKELIQNSSFK